MSGWAGDGHSAGCGLWTTAAADADSAGAGGRERFAERLQNLSPEERAELLYELSGESTEDIAKAWADEVESFFVSAGPSDPPTHKASAGEVSVRRSFSEGGKRGSRAQSTERKTGFPLARE